MGLTSRMGTRAQRKLVVAVLKVAPCVFGKIDKKLVVERLNTLFVETRVDG
jgi:hypothetical protein